MDNEDITDWLASGDKFHMQLKRSRTLVSLWMRHDNAWYILLRKSFATEDKAREFADMILTSRI